ncbi:MAG TPA: MFS transporter [Acidimicrobiales bacterium]|jgi:predicted MFS family arabinose efflux permease
MTGVEDSQRPKRSWSRLGRPQAPEARLDQADDAQVDGDLPYTPGTARGALSHPAFRSVWLGTFASNVGTWMQNIALGVFAYQLTHSATYVAAIGFAQLGPLFVLSIVGGALADLVDRKRLLIGCQVEQLLFSLALAWAASRPHPSTQLVFWCVLAIGIGNALNAPVLSAVLPVLVPKRDLPGAVSLQSVQMNLSRVIGPAIGGLLLPVVDAWGIFILNAGTYGFAIYVIARAAIRRAVPGTDPGRRPSGIQRLLGGLEVARTDPLVRYCLVTIFSVSFFCLPFIGLMPVVAARDLHINPAGAVYGGLYALFGLGAALGAVSVGTVFVGTSRLVLIRAGLAGFALCLGVFGLIREIWFAYPIVLAVGYAYFVTVTALSTAIQAQIDDEVRGRVMALWIMGFGGTVPLGLIAGGAVASATSVSAVVVGGAVVALLIGAMAWMRAPAVEAGSAGAV